MNLPFAVALLGLAVSAWFGFAAVRELKRDVPGHARNAAMIHIAMVSMLVPFSLIVIVAFWPGG
jgi:heme/copper-type cytochrome/quinol oxidase subunit 2